MSNPDPEIEFNAHMFDQCTQLDQSMDCLYRVAQLAAQIGITEKKTPKDFNRSGYKVFNHDQYLCMRACQMLKAAEIQINRDLAFQSESENYILSFDELLEMEEARLFGKIRSKGVVKSKVRAAFKEPHPVSGRIAKEVIESGGLMRSEFEVMWKACRHRSPSKPKKKAVPAKAKAKK